MSVALVLSVVNVGLASGASCQPMRFSAMATPIATAVEFPEGEIATEAATACTLAWIEVTLAASITIESDCSTLRSTLASAAPNKLLTATTPPTETPIELPLPLIAIVAAAARAVASIAPERVAVTWIIPVGALTGIALEPESSITASTVDRNVLRPMAVATLTAIDLPSPTESDAEAERISERIPLMSSAVTATLPPLDRSSPAPLTRAIAPLEPRFIATIGAT